MPCFDLVGFWLPMLLTGIYLPRAAKSVPYPQLLFFAVAGLLSYLFPISHENGVGVWAFYLIFPIGYFIIWLIRGGNKDRRMPTGPIFACGFLSVAIPDAFLTFERYGKAGIVGAMGLNDGLICFGLLPMLLSVAFWSICERLISNDVGVSFTWKESLAFHLSLIPESTRLS